MNLDKLFAGWGFRTNRPVYEPGDELTAYVTGYDEQGAIVRIGDTRLHLPDAEPGLVDGRIRLRVTDFDADAREGTAVILDVYERP